MTHTTSEPLQLDRGLSEVFLEVLVATYFIVRGRDMEERAERHTIRKTATLLFLARRSFRGRDEKRIFYDSFTGRSVIKSRLEVYQSYCRAIGRGIGKCL